MKLKTVAVVGLVSAALAVMPQLVRAQVDSVGPVVQDTSVTVAQVDTTAVAAVRHFVVAMLTGLLPGFPEPVAALIGDLLGTVACSFPVIPVVWLVGVLSAFLLKRIPALAAWLSPYWEKVRWWVIPLLAAVGSHFIMGSAVVGLAAAGLKQALAKGLPAMAKAIKKNTPEGIKHAGQVAVLLALGLGLTVALSNPAEAAGGAASVFGRATYAVGIVAVQDSVGSGQVLHVRGAFKGLVGLTVRDHIGLRAFVTQPFTDAGLRKPRPTVEAGVFWVF